MDERLGHAFKRLAANNDFDEIMSYRVKEEIDLLLSRSPLDGAVLGTILTRYHALNELVDWVRQIAKEVTDGR